MSIGPTVAGHDPSSEGSQGRNSKEGLLAVPYSIASDQGRTEKPWRNPAGPLTGWLVLRTTVDMVGLDCSYGKPREYHDDRE